MIARKKQEIERMQIKLKMLTGCHGHSHAVDALHEDAVHGPAHATAAQTSTSVTNASIIQDAAGSESTQAANGLVL